MTWKKNSKRWSLSFSQFTNILTHTSHHQKRNTLVSTPTLSASTAWGGEIIILISMMLWRASQFHLSLSPSRMSFTNSSPLFFLFSSVCQVQFIGIINGTFLERIASATMQIVLICFFHLFSNIWLTSNNISFMGHIMCKIGGFLHIYLWNLLKNL